MLAVDNKVFCAHCAVHVKCHAPADIGYEGNQWVCDRPRTALVLVGLLPLDTDWIEFVTRETNGAVAVDGRIWPKG